jgi:O-methyltransferase
MFTKIKSILISNRYIIGFYFKWFRNNKYQSYKNYLFSDENLKFVHLLEAVNYCKVAELPYVYFEFGCHSARTFSAVINASEYLKLNMMKFYAFDSFEGLPNTSSDEDGVFQTGEFSTPISKFKDLVKNKTNKILSDDCIVKGFYSDSLTTELQKQMPKVGIVHIDVDLYSSTKEVLSFLKPLFTVGTVILFDDYYCFKPDGTKGEMKALTEFCEETPGFKIKEWKAYSTFGQSFFVTSC